MDITLNRILDLIWKNGINEVDFCTAVGINKSAVTDWKKGKTTSYKRHINKIADFFGVSADYLLGKTDKYTEVDTSPHVDNDEASEILNIWHQLDNASKAIIKGAMYERLERQMINESEYNIAAHGGKKIIEITDPKQKEIADGLIEKALKEGSDDKFENL